MNRVVKIRGISQPQLGNVGIDKVLRFKDATLVAVPGSLVHDYLTELPLDQLDLDYSPELFWRWIPNMPYEQLWFGDYRYAVYWNAVIVVGLIPGIAFAVPNTPELQSALILGRGMLLRMFDEHFTLYQKPEWVQQFELPPAEWTEVPVVQWIEHTF